MKTTEDTSGCTIRLVLGDQLNPQHRWFHEVDDATIYVLMEVRQETGYVLHHAQKILAIFAAMRDLACQLCAAGHRVHYLAIDDPHNLQSIPANIDALIVQYGATAFQYQAPGFCRVVDQTAEIGRKRSCAPHTGRTTPAIAENWSANDIASAPSISN